MEADWRTLMGEDENTCLAPELASLPKNELKDFVMGLVDGRIFTSSMLSEPELVRNVFLPLIAIDFSTWSKEDFNNLGVIWSYYGEQQAPTYINGNPIFFSCRFMCKDDWHRASLAASKEAKRRKEQELEI